MRTAKEIISNRLESFLLFIHDEYGMNIPSCAVEEYMNKYVGSQNLKKRNDMEEADFDSIERDHVDRLFDNDGERKHKILQKFINRVYEYDCEVALDPEFNMIVQRYFWDLI